MVEPTNEDNWPTERVGRQKETFRGAGVEESNSNKEKKICIFNSIIFILLSYLIDPSYYKPIHGKCFCILYLKKYCQTILKGKKCRLLEATIKPSNGRAFSKALHC